MTDDAHRIPGAPRRPQAPHPRNPARLRARLVPLSLCTALLLAPLVLAHRPGRGHSTRVVTAAAPGPGTGTAHRATGAAGRSRTRVLTAQDLAALEASPATAGADGVMAESASPAVPLPAPVPQAAAPGSASDSTAPTGTAPTRAVPATTAPTTTAPARRAPATAPTPTRPAVAPTTTTTRPPPTTTTTRPAPTTTTTRPPAHSQTGSASWYQATAGTCASPNLAFGTVVTVTNLANGATTRCTVEDRGPYQGGRILDLAESTFAQIASPSDGVIQVRITW